MLNCIVGWNLCVPDDTFWPKITTYIGLFLAGFACGMPVAGIRGVVITLTRYLDQGQPKVDYTNPDGCGGFLFLGEALVKFSAVTLVVGLLLSIYILEVKWLPSSNNSSVIVQATMWMWITLPFLLSLTILLAPASRANHALTNHKIQVEVELALSLNNSRDALQEAGNDADRRDEIRREIEYYSTLRTQLHQMRTWPLNPETNIKFVILFISNAWVALESIRSMITTG